MGGDGAVTATVALAPALVATRAPGFMAQAQLDVAGDKIELRLPPSLLPGYAGLSIPMVPVAILRLPAGVRCAPDGAAATYSKKTGTLVVTVPVAP